MQIWVIFTLMKTVGHLVAKGPPPPPLDLYVTHSLYVRQVKDAIAVDEDGDFMQRSFDDNNFSGIQARKGYEVLAG